MSPGLVARAGRRRRPRAPGRRRRRRCGSPSAPTGLAARRLVEGCVPRLDRRRSARGLITGQISTRPGCVGPHRLVQRRRHRRRTGRAGWQGSAKTASTAASTSRVERKDCVSCDSARSRAPAARRPSAKWPRMRGELGRGGALEGEDRLLLVADREDGARARAARPGAGGELMGEEADDRPIASGWCPAPRRPGYGRCRGRACRAPSRRRPAAAARGCG